MNRRGFLGGLVGCAGGLWLPKVYSFGPGVGLYQWAEVGWRGRQFFAAPDVRPGHFGVVRRSDGLVARPPWSGHDYPLGIVTRTWWGDSKGRPAH